MKAPYVGVTDNIRIIRSLFAVVTLLVLAVGAHAQVINADLTVRLQPSAAPARPGQNLTWIVTAVNNGPAHAQNVVVTVDIPGDPVIVPGFYLACTSGHPVRCTAPILEPNSTSGIAFITANAPAAAGTYAVTATI